jgi:hypothetical protein
MTVIISKSDPEKSRRKLKKVILKKKKTKGLTEHFGGLKRDFDGMDYQHAIRSNED